MGRHKMDQANGALTKIHWNWRAAAWFGKAILAHNLCKDQNKHHIKILKKKRLHSGVRLAKIKLYPHMEETVNHNIWELGLLPVNKL